MRPVGSVPDPTYERCHRPPSAKHAEDNGILVVEPFVSRQIAGDRGSPRPAQTMMLSSLHPLSLFASLLLVASFVDVVNCQPGAAEQHSASATPPDEHLAVDFLLKSGVSIPLVGMGIGNLAHGEIPRAVRDQLASGVRLIDTAHASNNERILADAISDFDRSSGGGRGGSLRSGGGDGNGNDDDPIHVVTKVWYTHLGYERTKLSVAESLRELQLPAGSSRRILVHLLLHWPRCNDAISWMHCEEEEEKLPQSVKDAGPPPHSDMDNAFKESWRALEVRRANDVASSFFLFSSYLRRSPPPTHYTHLAHNAMAHRIYFWSVT